MEEEIEKEFIEMVFRDVKDILAKYCDPKPEFDGITLHEIAKKIIDVYQNNKPLI